MSPAHALMVMAIAGGFAFGWLVRGHVEDLRRQRRQPPPRPSPRGGCPECAHPYAEVVVRRDPLVMGLRCEACGYFRMANPDGTMPP